MADIVGERPDSNDNTISDKQLSLGVMESQHAWKIPWAAGTYSTQPHIELHGHRQF